MKKNDEIYVNYCVNLKKRYRYINKTIAKSTIKNGMVLVEKERHHAGIISEIIGFVNKGRDTIDTDQYVLIKITKDYNKYLDFSYFNLE